MFQWIVRLQTSHTLPLFFIMTSQLKHWKHYKKQLITCEVIMKNNGKVRNVCSLACKIKVLNRRVPGTWKWTIYVKFYANYALLRGFSNHYCNGVLVSVQPCICHNLGHNVDKPIAFIKFDRLVNQRRKRRNPFNFQGQNVFHLDGSLIANNERIDLIKSKV